MHSPIQLRDLNWLQEQVDGWRRLRPFEAEEVVELTLVEYGRKHEEIHDQRRWLLAAAKRVALSYRRRCAKEEVNCFDLDSITATRPDVSDGIRPLSLAIVTALGTLATGQREMVEMCDMAGMTVSEAAIRLDVPYETAKSWRSRGKARLRRLLGRHIPN